MIIKGRGREWILTLHVLIDELGCRGFLRSLNIELSHRVVEPIREILLSLLPILPEFFFAKPK